MGGENGVKNENACILYGIYRDHAKLILSLNMDD
jgi:hypothetical protein